MTTNEIDTADHSAANRRGVKAEQDSVPKSEQAPLKHSFEMCAKVEVKIVQDGEENWWPGIVVDLRQKSNGWEYTVEYVKVDGSWAKHAKADGNMWFVEESEEIREDRNARV